MTVGVGGNWTAAGKGDSKTEFAFCFAGFSITDSCEKPFTTKIKSVSKDIAAIRFFCIGIRFFRLS